MAALRRFVLLVGAFAGGTVVLSLAFGLLAGAAAGRAVSVGLYGVGCFLLVGGFFVGNRGPARLKRDEETGPFGFGGRRRLRWATPEEREDALGTSAIFVAVGFVLILLGVVADSRHELV